jgi:DNA-directed RNA polymerase sigma subunit (sigma70/sigma32)
MATLMKNAPKATHISRLVREKVESLLLENYDYMDNPLFRKKGIERTLFDADAEVALPLTSWYQPTRDEELPATAGAPQLMNAQQERMMFLRFNYSKRRLQILQKKIKKDGLTRECAEEFLEWHRKFEHFREFLVRTNLALVLAMAKRTRLGDVDFAEIVSEGNMALLRAVDKFDIDRGFKFSTYACRAILKAFSRTALKANKHRTRFPVEFEPDYEKSDWIDRRRDMVQEDLSDELRQIIGVTKERVRQIQNKALAKIRSVMEDGVLRVEPKPAPEPEAAHEMAL